MDYGSLCQCDFCTRKKSWADGWCPRCGDMMPTVPGNLCVVCDEQVRKELIDDERREREEADAQRLGHQPNGSAK